MRDPVDADCAGCSSAILLAALVAAVALTLRDLAARVLPAIG
jgi:hypothetical protein